MRINNNLMAMNTHRQLGNAGAAGAKSMGKLSSGLRINNAADDAAGLSISEKMRGQIRGLNQASANAQDGISMIQTAEGALSETHAILQRMRELAVQASNDTNVGVDRGEIQKEMNQLTSEINRIGNTTEFNTQKVLNGGGEVKDIATNTMKSGSAAGAMKGSSSIAAGTVLTAGVGADVGIEVVNGVTQTIDFGAANGAAANALTVKYAAGGSDAAATAAIVGNDITITLGTTAANNTAALVQSALQGLTLPDSMDGLLITVTTDITGASPTLEAGATAANAVTGGVTEVTATEGSSSIPVTAKTTSTAAVAAEWDAGALTVLTDGQSGSINFAGVTIEITAEDNNVTPGVSEVNQTGAKLAIDSVATSSAADQAAKIVEAFNAVKADQPSTGSLANFTFGLNDAGNGVKITGAKVDGATNNKNVVTNVVANGTSSEVTIVTDGVTEVRGEYTLEIEDAFEKEGATLNIAGKEFKSVASGAKASDGEFNVGTDAKEQAISIAAALNADSSINARFDALVDGSRITLKEKAEKATGTALDDGMVVGPTNDSVAGKISFNLDESVAVGGKYSVAGVNIEVTDDASHKGLVDGSAVLFSEDTTQQASNLANAIASNVKLNENFEVEASSNRITLTQKEGKESMTEAKISTSTSKNEGFEATFQVGANSGQGMTIQVEDMRSIALGLSGDESGASAIAKNGVKANYVTTSNVSNGTDNTAVEFSLDVSGHEKAQAAASVINDAIEKVSAQRSELGSFQNRLEHTIKNLDTSAENLQASEARIRDVDMAKEMMEITKQNILQQASTAMLAQANQAPQGVLQLLR